MGGEGREENPARGDDSAPCRLIERRGPGWGDRGWTVIGRGLGWARRYRNEEQIRIFERIRNSMPFLDFFAYG
ncbi:hypothetical protein NL676_017471 [Syzygium grande]|nr:hypothetical protein NL676_017471 [Syzygium grande]